MTRKTLVLLTIILTFVSSAQADSPEEKTAPEKPGWELVFEDNFDNETVLSPEKWIDAYRPGRAEYYALKSGKPSDFNGLKTNYVIENGILKLRIDRDLPKRKDVQTPCVSSIQTSRWTYNPETGEFGTLDKFTTKYGLFEVRCRMPKGSGLHSAFWLLQKGAREQEISPDGKRGKIGDGVVEIDIFEMQGRKVDARINDFNVHFTRNGHYEYRFDFDCSKEFHTWGLNWEEGKLTWYLDGKEIYTYVGPTPQSEMLILLGLYHNCGWTGRLDPNLPYPLDFEIDWIRVWKKK
jgi:beta-glucanase (GH16 family)